MSPTLDAESLPLVPGAVAGLVAWALGYLVTYLIAAPDVRESPLNRFLEVFGDGGAVYEVVGWVFFNAHFVDTVIDAGFFGGGAASFVGGDGFTPALYLVPPALLFGAGLAVARIQGTTATDDGAVGGALVAVPYLLLCIAGAVLFRVEAGGASGQPDLLPAVILAGVVYPAVFGAVGGAVGALTADSPPSRL